MVLLQAEVWETACGTAGDDVDAVLTQFVKVQKMWEHAFLASPYDFGLDGIKKFGIRIMGESVDIIKVTGSSSDMNSPMMHMLRSKRPCTNLGPRWHNSL